MRGPPRSNRALVRSPDRRMSPRFFFFCLTASTQSHERAFKSIPSWLHTTLQTALLGGFRPSMLLGVVVGWGDRADTLQNTGAVVGVLDLTDVGPMTDGGCACLFPARLPCQFRLPFALGLFCCCMRVFAADIRPQLSGATLPQGASGWACGHGIHFSREVKVNLSRHCAADMNIPDNCFLRGVGICVSQKGLR